MARPMTSDVGEASAFHSSQDSQAHPCAPDSSFRTVNWPPRQSSHLSNMRRRDELGRAGELEAVVEAAGPRRAEGDRGPEGAEGGGVPRTPERARTAH